MSFSQPIDPQQLLDQFEHAALPFWLVDEQLSVVGFNDFASRLYPTHCTTDGIRMFFSPIDTDDICASIAAGNSIRKRLSAASHRLVTYAFVPYHGYDGKHGAYVLLTPAIDPLAEETGSNPDIRQSLEGVGNLVVATRLRSYMADVFYALSVASANLKTAGVDIADSQLKTITQRCYQVLRTTKNLSEKVMLTPEAPPITRHIDFWGSCAELLETCGTLLKSARHSFSYSLPDSTVYVCCDFDKITCALLNVISNSYLYGEEPVDVTVNGHDLDGRILLTITDNGPGIPQRIKERLYQPFCSWDTLERDNTGIGLGLHITREIFTQAGGTVTIDSSGDGTTVALSLPTCLPDITPPSMGVSSKEYAEDRLSPVYLGLCDIVPPPEL